MAHPGAVIVGLALLAIVALELGAQRPARIVDQGAPAGVGAPGALGPPDLQSAFVQTVADTTVIEPDTRQRDIKVRRGEAATVAFEVSSGSGYQWIPQSPLPPGVRVLGNDFKSLSTDKLGGRSRQLITFALDGPKGADVVVVFRRSWVPPTPNDPQTTLQFSVTE
jgi:hypothetical protein